jgi:hypothetical protein
MYDPETGEKERAEKPEDHERLKALGWGHEPPVNEASADLCEAKMSLGAKTAQKQIYSLEASLKVGSNLNKGVNKSLGGKYDADFKNMEKAIGEIHSIWEDIEYDYKNLGFSKQVGEASVDEAVNSLDRKKAARNGAKFKWEDINKALMKVGMSPPNILKVSSALRGKEQ